MGAALEGGKSDSDSSARPVNPILLRRRAQTWLSLHLSLEVPASELEVTGNFQGIFFKYIFCSNLCISWGVLWVDEMTRLLYLLLRPSLSADLEIMANSTPPPPLLLLSSSASLLEAQQRGTIHHFTSSSDQGHLPGWSGWISSVGFNLKGLWLLR